MAQFEIIDIVCKEFNRNLELYFNGCNRKLPLPNRNKITKSITYDEYLQSKPVWKNILKSISSENIDFNLRMFIDHIEIMIKYWSEIRIFMNYINKSLELPQWRIIFSPKMLNISKKYKILDEKRKLKEDKKGLINSNSVNFVGFDINVDIKKFEMLKNIHKTLSNRQIINVFCNEFSDIFINKFEEYIK